LVNDFYKVLDHEAIELAHELGTSIANLTEINYNSLKAGRNDFLKLSENGEDNRSLDFFVLGTEEYAMLINGMVGLVN